MVTRWTMGEVNLCQSFDSLRLSKINLFGRKKNKASEKVNIIHTSLLLRSPTFIIYHGWVSLLALYLFAIHQRLREESHQATKLL